MFTPSEIEQVPEKITKLVSQLEFDLMNNIVDRIGAINEISRTTDYEIYKLNQLGLSSEEIKKRIKEKLEFTDQEIDRIFSEVIAEGYARDEDIYNQVGKPFVSYEENEELKQLTKAISVQTKEEFRNITQSTGFAIRMGNKTVFTPMAEYYQNILDKSMTEILTGSFDYNSVLRNTVKEMTNSGIRTVDYATGHTDRIEVATRRAIMTGFAQVTSKITEDNAKQLDTKYFEVSWHSTARPSHQIWQGRVYSEDELVTVCGLGTITGLKGANCYHECYAFIPGISVRSYTDEELDALNAKENELKEYEVTGKKYTTYEATQHQRRLEQIMRAQRQEIKLLEKGNADKGDILAAKSRYRSTMAQYVDFSTKMKLPQQRDRIYMDGLGKVGGGIGVAKNPKSDIIKMDKQFGKKIGKHTKEYQLDPSKPEDRTKMRNIIDDILINKDEVVQGVWRAQEGTVDFYIKGNDVVVVNNNKFVTILKDGVNNARVKDARKRKI